jgi:rhodanese-related sulfurtransferase
MEQPSRYQKLVADAKSRIEEISPGEAAEQAGTGAALLVDVREKDEWEEGHAAGAVHLSRGMLEVEIEEVATDANQTILVYCGAGGRSALAADNLQKMGFNNVRSVAGGFKAWSAAGLPTEK